MIDVHSHILPGIDDGCKNIKESLKTLDIMKEHGLQLVLATPHYYAMNENVEAFLKRRKESYESLMEVLSRSDDDYPEIQLGAEVYFFRGMSNVENLHDLCIEGTDYILIELPFREWDTSIFEELENLSIRCGITPIIAHVNRYLEFGNDLYDDRIMSYPVQINTEAFSSFFKMRKWIKYMKKAYYVLLGSDTHNSTNRAPNLRPTFDLLYDKAGEDLIEKIENTEKIIIST